MFKAFVNFSVKVVVSKRGNEQKPLPTITNHQQTSTNHQQTTIIYRQ